MLTGCRTIDDSGPVAWAPIEDCDGTMPTGPQMISDPSFSAFVSGLRLPQNVQVSSGGARVSTARPDQVDLTLDLCLPGSADLDGLVPVATDLARALKRHELGTRTAALSVACVGPDMQGRMEVRDPDFQVHPWDGTPSPAAESRVWEVFVE
ncbi:hypothetical protein FB390_6015 [Nocardia bhagyanarayanae]|uniref:Uncharacterized protein n=2 Tax=Nocardia bhagyanarayanae TaxID=1215925 RepID=A0A543EW81_9NOCA|nr:hypothetical protein FB390_6015 [Nocardia bhagyanarayanae]